MKTRHSSRILTVVFLATMLAGGFLPCRAGFLLMQYEYQRALRQRKSVGKDILQAGESYYQERNYQEAIPFLCAYMQQYGGWELSNEMIFMTEAQRAEYWEKEKKPFTEYVPALAYMTRADSLVAETYNCALLSKGCLLNTSTTMRKYILESGDAALKEVYDSYTRLKNQYNRLLANHTEQQEAALDTLGCFVDSLGGILKEKIPTGRFAVLLNLQWTDIQESLGEDEAAIEFIDFPTPEGKTVYAALLVRRGFTAPVMEPLFSADELTLSGGYPYVDQSLAYQKIWKKLVPRLYGVSNVYFSPTGILHKIPLEYLPDEQALPVNWLFNLYRLSSTRELLTARASKKADMKTVLYGGLNYTMTGAPRTQAAAPRGGEQSAALLRTVGKLRGAIKLLPDLPRTYNEVLAISDGLRERGVGCQLYSGDEGTERSFRSLDGKSVDIIHIATHGFYLPADSATGQAADPSGELTAEDQVMLQSGIFMAGANQTLRKGNVPYGDTANDGVMTAKEVSQLDLSHTDLVTLSACETALGEIGSDGVFGLQRGFKKAGVQSEIVSLWPVDDEATSVFMTSFYKYYLASNSKYRALKLAQQALCRYHSGKYNEQRYWGAFILIDGMDFTEEQTQRKAALVDSIYKEHTSLKIHKQASERLQKLTERLKLKAKSLIDAANDSTQAEADKQAELELENTLIEMWKARRKTQKQPLDAKSIEEGMQKYGLKP